MRGKIIVIEGTDCSGKETQSKLLVNKLNECGVKTLYYSFPNYNSVTGKIIAGPLLGKEYVCDTWFDDLTKVDPRVISLYYAADRKFNIKEIEETINDGTNVVLDRYVYSNMAYQAGKYEDEKQKKEMISWIEKLEFEFLELPKGDIKVFLHMPTEVGSILRRNREEKLDEHEKNSEYLKKAEKTYIEIANDNKFKTIECAKNSEPRSIDDISVELFDYIKGFV